MVVSRVIGHAFQAGGFRVESLCLGLIGIAV